VVNEFQEATSAMAIAIALGVVIAVVVLLLPSGNGEEYNPIATREPEGDGPHGGWVLFAVAVVIVVCVVIAG